MIVLLKPFEWLSRTRSVWMLTSSSLSRTRFAWAFEKRCRKPILSAMTFESLLRFQRQCWTMFGWGSASQSRSS